MALSSSIAANLIPRDQSPPLGPRVRLEALLALNAGDRVQTQFPNDGPWKDAEGCFWAHAATENGEAHLHFMACWAILPPDTGVTRIPGHGPKWVELTGYDPGRVHLTVSEGWEQAWNAEPGVFAGAREAPKEGPAGYGPGVGAVVSDRGIEVVTVHATDIGPLRAALKQHRKRGGGGAAATPLKDVQKALVGARTWLKVWNVGLPPPAQPGSAPSASSPLVRAVSFLSAPMIAYAPSTTISGIAGSVPLVTEEGARIDITKARAVFSAAREGMRCTLMRVGDVVVLLYERQVHVLTRGGGGAGTSIIGSVAITRMLLEAARALVRGPGEWAHILAYAPETASKSYNPQAGWHPLAGSMPEEEARAACAEAGHGDLFLADHAAAARHLDADWHNSVHVRLGNGVQVVVHNPRMELASRLSHLVLGRLDLRKALENRRGALYLAESSQRLANGLIRDAAVRASFHENRGTGTRFHAQHLVFFLDPDATMTADALEKFVAASFVYDDRNNLTITPEARAQFERWTPVIRARDSRMKPLEEARARGPAAIFEEWRARFIRNAGTSLYVACSAGPVGPYQMPYYAYALLVKEMARVREIAHLMIRGGGNLVGERGMAGATKARVLDAAGRLDAPGRGRPSRKHASFVEAFAESAEAKEAAAAKEGPAGALVAWFFGLMDGEKWELREQASAAAAAYGAATLPPAPAAGAPGGALVAAFKAAGENALKRHAKGAK
jgi:hypothetical protein